MPLAGFKLPSQPLHFRPPHCELRQFFRITDCSMSLSRLNRLPASSAAHSPLAAASAPVLRLLPGAVFRFPGVNRVLPYSVFAAYIRCASASFHLLQRFDDLCFRVTTLAHLSLPSVSNRILIRTDFGAHVTTVIDQKCRLRDKSKAPQRLLNRNSSASGRHVVEFIAKPQISKFTYKGPRRA